MLSVVSMATINRATAVFGAGKKNPPRWDDYHITKPNKEHTAAQRTKGGKRLSKMYDAQGEKKRELNNNRLYTAAIVECIFWYET